MEELLSLFLFAAALFFVMRFGFGAGIKKRGDLSGSYNHGNGIHNNNQQTPIDLVCGMEVDVEQCYGKMHDGKLYRFCSQDCMNIFEADPEQYLDKQEHGGHPNDGGAL